MKPTRLLLACVVLAAALMARAADPVDTVVTSEHFESLSTDETMTTTFWGNVVVTGTEINITCDRVVIVVLRTGDTAQVVAKENNFQSMIATGRVKIVQGYREATCGRAEVLPGEKRINLLEKPMVVDKEAGVTWVGDNLYVLRDERRVFGENVKVIFPPVPALSFDPKKALEGVLPPSAPETKK